MGSGIRIPFAADVRDWLRGTRKIRDDLDDVDDALDDLRRSSDRASDDIGDDFDDAGDDIARIFRDIEQDAENAFDRMERDAGDAGDNMADKVRRPFTDTRGFRGAMGALAAEAFDELVESWGEAVRSGDLTEAIRDTFSNLGQIGGAIFGPIGALGGGAASLVLTTLYDTLKADALRADELRALADGVAENLFGRIVDRAQSAGVSAGSQFIAGLTTVEAQTETLEQLFGDLPSALAAIVQQADDWQIPAETVKDAYLGYPAALETIEGRLDDIRRMQEANETLANAYLAAGEEVPGTLQLQITKLNEAESEMSDLLTAAEGVQRETALTRAGVAGWDRLFGDASNEASDLEQETSDIRDNVNNTRDLDITAKVDRSEIDRLPTSRRLDVTVSLSGSTARNQRLLDQGIFD